MTEAGPSQINNLNPSSTYTLSPPVPSTTTVPDMSSTLRSRPLSEISDNEQRRRSSARQSLHSVKGEKGSRPPSEIKDDTRRLSVNIATITLNLNDYATVTKRPPSAVSTKSRDSLTSPTAVAGPSVNRNSTKLERPVSYRTVSVSSIKEIQQEQAEANDEPLKYTEPDTKEGHPLLMAKRASLRPSPLGATYADIAKSEPPTPSIETKPHLLPTDSTASLAYDSPRSSIDSTGKPLPKTKPSWLRRASGTAALRSKSKSPVPREELTASASLPPQLPPRRGVAAASDNTLSKPPDHPSKTSYASIAAAGSSRSRLGDGAGRPAFSPPISTQPTRDNLNIRSRIAAWTSTPQPQPTLSRSDSSNTIATTASSVFTGTHQRLPSSAQRMIGSAGSAVQKGWAGLRARGMGGSISGLSSIASGEGRRGSLEPPKFARKTSRDRSVSAQATMGAAVDGPVLDSAAILRLPSDRAGKVFGKDITEAGRAWGVVDVGTVGISAWERRRRECLPAVVIRAVEYLDIWGPKEEGIFRISGRSSHINRLRRDFDSGADIDMTNCHPGDLDPHAVSGIFKSYLRDLPSPLLTKELSPRFEAAVRESANEGTEDISALLLQIPAAHWFLLADIVRLLELIPSHSSANRMTLNALMLSLGPSLNIPGTVLTELLERRIELFSTPPPISAKETAMDLIDFGETSVAMPSIEEISRSSTPTSRNALESPALADKPRKSMYLSNKPSLSRLFSAASPNPPRKDEPMVPIVQPSPPRVELRTDSPRLPSFESDEKREDLMEKRLPQQPTESAEIPYPSGTVDERSKLFSTATPIADMYAGTSALPALRGNKTSDASATSMASLPGLEPPVNGMESHSAPNPASFARRGPSIFFQSGSTDRHGRSTSANGNAGTKRKDDNSAAEADNQAEDNRVKRLSAGPGSVNVRDSIRGLEMLA